MEHRPEQLPSSTQAPSSGDAVDEPVASSIRPSLAAKLLDGEELQRLLALRAATTELTPIYGALLAVLTEAKAAYRLQLRTSEIVDLLTEADAAETRIDQVAIRPGLDQLKEWGCVDWVQDPSFRAASIEEYLRRHELWEITPVGEATIQAIAAVLGASEQAGSLQRALFQQISGAIEELTVAIASSDATSVYLRLRDLDLAITDLASNARDFYATVNRIAREDRIEDHVFLSYKDQLIDYLQTFAQDLGRHRAMIGRALADLDRLHRRRLLELVVAGDDSAGLFALAAAPAEQQWERRWQGMLDWFISRPGRRSEAEALSDATTVAIRELLTLLRRLTEQSTRPVTRAAELRKMAAWFASCNTDADAHELFDAAFGLTPTVHLGMPLADADAGGRFPSWWSAEPVPVPVSLREHGRRPAPGRSGKRQNYAEAKRQLARQLEHETRVMTEATRHLVSIDLADTEIDPTEFGVLLNLLDRALAARPAGHDFDVEIKTFDARVRLRSAPTNTRVTCPVGTLTLFDCELMIESAA